MGKQGSLNGKEQIFVKARFFRYYSQNKPFPPPRIGLREWGFFMFGIDGMVRPVTFSSSDELSKFLFRKVPRHSYYSSAYYRNPEKPMKSPEKGWMGADLIFDLDADGIPEAEKLSYEEQLAEVKKEIIRLYDIFLQQHLGFSDKELYLVFSGGRGYHIHIRATRVLDMDSEERREIMDYVAGAFVDFEEVFPKRRVMRARSYTEIPIIPREGGGWKGIAAASANSVIKDMMNGSEEDAVEMMKSAGIRRDIAKRIYDRLYGDKGGYRRALENGSLDIFRTDSEIKNFIKLVEHRARQDYSVHPDIHVTGDVRRLIRLPGSLHGGTGFVVKPLSRNELEDFEPTRDAVPEVYGDEKVPVKSEEKHKIRMKGEDFVVKGNSDVPEYLAVFLLLSGRAHLGKV